MDSLEAHKVKLDFHNKTFDFIDESGNSRTMKDIPEVISIRQISAVQMQKSFRKGCELYAVHVLK